MSKFLDDFNALLEKVAVGNAGDPETKQAVADLTARLTSDEATEGETQTAVTALVSKLADSTPATPAPGAAS